MCVWGGAEGCSSNAGTRITSMARFDMCSTNLPAAAHSHPNRICCRRCCCCREGKPTIMPEGPPKEEMGEGSEGWSDFYGSMRPRHVESEDVRNALWATDEFESDEVRGRVCGGGGVLAEGGRLWQQQGVEGQGRVLFIAVSFLAQPVVGTAGKGSCRPGRA